ncbi:MAG TPA: hypothetical protein VEC35_09415 [Noviherbaspirillum sp.]|nr:hypothetical protein [Noviherbaspirillum sp.]
MLGDRAIRPEFAHKNTARLAPEHFENLTAGFIIGPFKGVSLGRDQAAFLVERQRVLDADMIDANHAARFIEKYGGWQDKVAKQLLGLGFDCGKCCHGFWVAK